MLASVSWFLPIDPLKKKCAFRQTTPKTAFLLGPAHVLFERSIAHHLELVLPELFLPRLIKEGEFPDMMDEDVSKQGEV